MRKKGIDKRPAMWYNCRAAGERCGPNPVYHIYGKKSSENGQKF